jgi:hypothetical protein
MAVPWHPLCEYAKIMNIPDNIQQDWLSAFNEVVVSTTEFYSDPKGMYQYASYYPTDVIRCAG